MPFMTIGIQAATRTAAVLLTTLVSCNANGAVDELSLVQMSAAQATAVDGGELGIFSHHGHNFTSLLAKQGFPGLKGMQDQIKEAAAFKVAPPEQGYHKKVVKALPKLQAECKTKPYTTQEDCDTSISMLTMMGKITEGPEPMWTWHGHLRTMLGLQFWLYTPGTMLCFSLLDMDQDTGISYEEMTKLFGAQMMASMSPVWKFMDPDGDSTITREELHKYLRAAILVRDVLPELDGVDPKADTRKCLNMAHRVLAPPAAPMKRMKFYPKLLSIAGIFIGAVALHCLFCTQSSRKAVDKVEEPPAPEKSPEKK